MKKAKEVEVHPGHYVLREAIFHRTVHLFVNCSRKQFEDWGTRRGIKFVGVEKPSLAQNIEGFSSQIDHTEAPSEWVVCLGKFDWTIRDQGTLLHELVHTIVKIWAYNNIPVTAETQEFFAHSISNLYEDASGKLLGARKQRKSGA